MNLEAENTSILIIDDNTANISTIADHLNEYGFETIIARDGEMGLQRARFSQPNLILLAEGFEERAIMALVEQYVDRE